MTDVVRYRLDGYDIGMTPAHDGVWVRFCDYAATRAALAEAQAEVARLTAAAAHSDACNRGLVRLNEATQQREADANAAAFRHLARANAAEAALADARAEGRREGLEAAAQEARRTADRLCMTAPLMQRGALEVIAALRALIGGPGNV